MFPGWLIKCLPHLDWYKPNLLEEGQNYLPTSTETLQENDPGARKEKNIFTTAARSQPPPREGDPVMGRKGNTSARSVWAKCLLYCLKLIIEDPNKWHCSSLWWRWPEESLVSAGLEAMGVSFLFLTPEFCLVSENIFPILRMCKL